MTEYFLTVSPLSIEEVDTLRWLVRQHGYSDVLRAIHMAALRGERTFAGFLKELDAVSPEIRTGRLTRVGSGLQRLLRKISPR